MEQQELRNAMESVAKQQTLQNTLFKSPEIQIIILKLSHIGENLTVFA